MFPDDRQVVSIDAVKVYDNEDMGEGGVDFVVESIEPGELVDFRMRITER